MKVYLRTSGNVAMQMRAYAHVFNGQVLKHVYTNEAERIESALSAKLSTYNYAYAELETGARIMLAPYRDSMPSRGYQLDLVLTYEDASKYAATIDRLTKSQYFKNDYPVTHYDYATLTKYYDAWGYGWVLELKKENRP